MKKFLSIMCVVVAMFALTACGKFTCDLCGEEKSGSGKKITIMGETGTLCDDCYDVFKQLGY